DRVYQQYLPAAEKKMEFLFKPALELQVFPGGGNFGFNFSTAYLNINPANTSRSTGLDLSGINVPDDLPDPDQIRKTLTRFERVESTQEPIDKSLTFSAGITYKIGGSKKTTPPKKDIPLPKDKDKDKDIIAGNEGQNQNKSSEALCNCDPFGAGGSALPEVVRLYKEMPYVYNVIPPPPIHMFYAVCYPGYNLTSNMNIIWDYGFDPISGSGDINMNGKYSLYHAEPEEITSEIFAIAPWPDTDTCHHTVKIPIPTPPECGAIVGGVPEPELDLIAHDTTNSNLRTLHNLQAKADFLLANNGWSTPTQEIYSFVQWTPVDGVHEGYQTAPTDSINHTFAASDFTNFGHSKVEYWVWEGSDFVCRKTYNVFYSNDTLWQKLYAGENGEFEIKNDVDSLYTYTAGVPFSGTGTAYIPGVVTTVEVEFQDIKADQLGNLVEGEILAKVDPSAPVYAKEWLLGAAGTLAGLDHDMVQDVLEWSDSNLVDVPFLGTSGPMAPLGDPAVNMPMILELDNASDSRFAITEMVFLPNQSKFNAMLALAAPAEWNAVEMLGFIAKGVRFHPTSLESPPDRIEIVDDILINNATDDISFRFKKAAVPYDPFHQGCYIAWDEDGFSQFGVELAAEFTRDWFTPIPDDSISKSTVTLVGTGAAWNDIILTGTWEKSQIEDAHGMTIEALNLNLDLSDSFNPVGMTFPLTYGSVTDTTSLWRGFYGESLTLELPPSWETNTGGPPAVGVQQVFIDDQGVTLEAFAHNVIAWPDADISDLNASVDTISVQFLMNSLTEAHVIGQIGLPASHPDSIQNPLKYHGYWLDSAAIALDTVFALAGPGSPEGGSMFALTIEPTGPINANLLKGDLLLEPTSMITAYKQDTVKYFGMNLDGSLAYVDKKLGPLKNINMEFGFQGLGFEYSNLDSLTFDLGTWSLASPQKKAHGFPLTVNSISFDPLPKTPGQKLHGSLDFDVTFSLGDTSSAISATSAFGIEFEILEDLVNDVKFKPHYLGLNLDSLAVTANLAAVNIAGYLTIDSDHAIYGKRITGGLSAYFKGPGIGATVDGVFGNTSYNHYEAYKYWSVDVGVVFGSAIPFLSGLGFYGFSGGAYGNMLLNLVETAPDVYAKTYTPDFGNLGFRAGATIGTMPLQDAFNADIQLEALFSTTGGGIQYIGFEGAFGTNAKIADRRIGKGKINGNLLTFYDFPNKHFYLGASATINSPPITTPSPISLALDINGLTSDWYFVCGKPDYDPPAPHLMNEVNLNFDSTGVGLNLYEYFMFGNSIPYPNGFTYKFRDAYYDQLGS
ncbi:MAG: hypothetical protein KJP00_06400, partial [Bacteroidia bacterium]|nr:hypothetical protein [Bacteroidia bacterium]